MQTYLLILFLLFSSGISFSQELSKLTKEGAELFYKEDYQKALKVFEKELKRDSSEFTRFWVASCYFKMNNFSKAKELLLKIIERDDLNPEHAMSLVNLGSCYRGLNQIDSAFYYYDITIYFFPDFASSYFNKGQLLYSLSRFEEAKITFDLGISLDATDWFIFMKRQEILFILHDFEGALRDLLKAKELKPDLDIAFNTAYAYSMIGNFQQADSIYQSVSDRESEDALFLNNYGFNKYRLGFRSEGIELIQKSLKLDPKNSFAYRNLALIAIDQKDQLNTCNYLSKSLELGFTKHYGREVEEMMNKYCK